VVADKTAAQVEVLEAAFFSRPQSSRLMGCFAPLEVEAHAGIRMEQVLMGMTRVMGAIRPAGAMRMVATGVIQIIGRLPWVEAMGQQDYVAVHLATRRVEAEVQRATHGSEWPTTRAT